MKSNIIYSFDDFRKLLNEKADVGTYFLLADDEYFEQIEKDRRINRQVFGFAREIARENREAFNVVKHITFKFKCEYTTNQLYKIIQDFRQRGIKIFLTFFEPEEQECTLVFISNGDDSLLEDFVSNFLETDQVENE